MKLKFLIVIVLLNYSSVFSQEDKTVTLTVSAQGATLSEAKQNALRDAIEQAFGAFISSNTEILNDELVKDEIVSVSNGNIQDYEVISEVQLPNGSYTTTLKATVSVTKLTSFVESKGVSVEFKGGLFAFKVNRQILNEKNEIKVIENVSQVIKNIADVSFDFTITASDPISLDASNSKWRIPISVSVYKNDNFNNIPKILHSTLKGISLSLEEARNYISLGKKVYPISYAANNTDYSYILLRQEESVKKLLSTLYYFNHSLQNFRVDNGIDQFKINSNKINNLKIKEDNFRIFVIKIGRCRSRETYIDGSVFSDISGNANSRNIIKEPILDWVKWASISRQWNGCGYGWSKYYEGYAFEVYTTNYPYDGFFNNRFTFVNKLSEQFINGESGVVISFSDLDDIDSFEDLQTQEYYDLELEDLMESEPNEELIELVRFYYEDIRTLDEIQNISEYTVKPISLYSSLSSTNYENKPKVLDKSNEASVVFKSTHYVNDPDGWTNFRDAPRGKILKRLDNKLQCKILSSENGWALVELKSSEKGYIHSTRLKSNSSKIFKIKIQKNRTNINVRKKPVNGVVVGQVSGGELYTVTNESLTDTPVYLLNNDMVLTDFKTGEKIDKPKDFKLNNVREHINNTYYAEIINTDETINKVYIEKNKVKIEYNSWFYLEEMKGWIYSVFCEKM